MNRFLKTMLLSGAFFAVGQGGRGATAFTYMPSGATAFGYGYVPVSHHTAKRMMDTQRDLRVVDVRTPQEYKSGHLPGAVLLPYEDIDPKTTQDLLPEKNRMLLVYCRSGHRSRQAATKLAALGYTKVYDMGGIGNWPYDMVRPN